MKNNSKPARVRKPDKRWTRTHPFVWVLEEPGTPTLRVRRVGGGGKSIIRYQATLAGVVVGESTSYRAAMLVAEDQKTSVKY